MLFTLFAAFMPANAVEPPSNPPVVLREGEYVPGQIIVSMKDNVSVSQGDLDAAARLFPGINVLIAKDLTDVSETLPLDVIEQNGIQLKTWDGPQILLLELLSDSQEDLLQAITVLEENRLVDCASPNFIDKANLIPNDPMFSLLWGMSKIQAPQAWDYTTGSRSVVVGVIDTGVDNTHVDLLANVNTALGYNYINPAQPYGDPHGTHVAGTIGAVGNNTTGVVGVNWFVTIAPFRTDGNHAYFISTMAQAHTLGIPIVNYSMGGYAYNPNIIAAINGYFGLVVAAAGNDTNNNDTNPHYPSSYNCANIIAVAASDQNDYLCGFSNYGVTTVHLAAPGDAIYSTLPGNSYGYASGTSMAAPHVAGAAALLKAYRPSLTTQEIKAAILNNVDFSPYLVGKVSTSGRLNLYKAIQNLPPLAPVTFQNPHASKYIPVDIGTTRTLNVINATYWDTNDWNIATVARDPSNYTQAYVTGVSVGAFGVTASASGATTSSRPFYVRDMSNIQSYMFADGGIGAIPNQYGTLTIPISATPVGAESQITWTSLDTAVATVNSSTRVVTAQVMSGFAVIKGVCVDAWGRSHTIIYRVNIGGGIAPAGAPPASGNMAGSFSSPHPSSYIPIGIGVTKTVNVINAYCWDTIDPDIISIVRDSTNYTQAYITAHSLGAVGIVACAQSGVMAPRTFYVFDYDNVQSYTLPNGGEGYIAGLNGVLVLPITATDGNGASADLRKITWSILEPAVASLSQNPSTGAVSITAQVARGHATLVGTCTDPWGREQTIIYRVKIG